MSQITEEFTVESMIAFINGALDDVQVTGEDTGTVLHEVYDPYDWSHAGANQQHCAYYIRWQEDPYAALTMSFFGGENGTPQTEGVKYPVTITAIRRRAGEPLTDRLIVWKMARLIRQRLNHAFAVQSLIPAGVHYKWLGSTPPRLVIPNVEAVEIRFEFVGVVHLIPS